MACEQRAQDRRVLMFFNSNMSAGQNLFAAFGAAQLPVLSSHGYRRLKGSLFIDKVPQLNQFQFNSGGSSSVFDQVVPLQATDPVNSPNFYGFDLPLLADYWTLALQANAVGISNVRLVVWGMPEGTGPAIYSSI